MQQKLLLEFDVELFDLEELEQAYQKAQQANGVLYSWKTTGISNWLERGVSNVDVLGVVVLPPGLADHIEMPDDEPEEIGENEK